MLWGITGGTDGQGQSGPGGQGLCGVFNGVEGHRKYMGGMAGMRGALERRMGRVGEDQGGEMGGEFGNLSIWEMGKPGKGPGCWEGYYARRGSECWEEKDFGGALEEVLGLWGGRVTPGIAFWCQEGTKRLREPGWLRGCLHGAPVQQQPSLLALDCGFVEWLLLVLPLGLLLCTGGKGQIPNPSLGVLWGRNPTPGPLPFSLKGWLGALAHFLQALCSPCVRGVVQFSVPPRFCSLKSNKN